MKAALRLSMSTSVAILTFVLAAAANAEAAGFAGPGIGGEAVDDEFLLGGKQESLPADPVAGLPVAGPARPSAYVSVSVPACPQNDPNLGGQSTATATCPASEETCPEGQQRRYRFTAPRVEGEAPTNQWTLAGDFCAAEAEPLEAAVPAFTVAELQRLPLEPGQLTVSPGGNEALINYPNNVYVRAQAQTFDTTLLGQPVRVRATPVRYIYDFGDGTVLGPTADAGAPAPNWVADLPVDEVQRALQVSHVYTEDPSPPDGVPDDELVVDHEVTVTTLYRGEYSVAGGAFQPVVGEATVVSDPYPVEVISSSPRLVADDLCRNGTTRC